MTLQEFLHLCADEEARIELEIDSGKEEYSYDSFWLSDYRSEGSAIRYSNYKVTGFRFCTESSTADITIEIIL